ncbi:MAG: transglutaminase family protein [Desulfobacterales bacterium]|jgi:transglutaminase-like putative cysteine protease|nr:transglutaminase family protein [Desulfobacterales bacterium]
MDTDTSSYLKDTPVIDFNSRTVGDFADQHSGNGPDPMRQAVSLYYAVRDGIRYDPYSIELSVEGLRASTTLKTGRGWCVAKAILLAACCRRIKIPARLGFADIRNHLSTERMRRQMKTDIFYWHGYTSIYLNGQWVKATPAFNIELCEKFRIKPLDFDGKNDSIYHPFDLTGNKHMEYLRYRGEFEDAPIDAIKETFYREYVLAAELQGADFDREVDRETAHKRG